MPLKVFLDTNIFLHFRHLSNLPLRELLDTDHVTVVLTRITIRELDRQKDQNASATLRHRARKALKDIEAWSNGEAVAPGIEFERLSNGPSVNLAQYGLDPTWADDVLIGTIIDYRERHPDENIVLITNDTGPRLKCTDLGIRAVSPNEDYALAPEQDESQAELRKLRQKVAKMESALPVLRVGFAGLQVGTQHKLFQVAAPTPIDNATIDDALEELAIEYPDVKPSSQDRSLRISIDGIALDPMKSYEKRVEKRNQYFRRYVEYLYSYHDFRMRQLLQIEFQFEIANEGNAPAEDVDAWFTFPSDRVEVFTEHELPSPPPMPQYPKEDYHLDLMKQLDTTSWLSQSLAANKRAMLPVTIERGEQLRVHFRSRRIKHGLTERLPALYVDLQSWELAESFQCEYEVRVANLVEPVHGTLHFQVEKMPE